MIDHVEREAANRRGSEHPLPTVPVAQNQPKLPNRKKPEPKERSVPATRRAALQMLAEPTSKPIVKYSEFANNRDTFLV